MFELRQALAGGRPCECGCGGLNGHILSEERYDPRARCSSMTTDQEHVFHRCIKPRGHSELVPHGDGETVWMGAVG